MIRSFRSRATERLWMGEHVRQFAGIARQARRKLDQMSAATVLSDLAALPGNKLEALRGNRAGQYSIRVNDQWRICFTWMKDGPADVEIVDYH